MNVKTLFSALWMSFVATMAFSATTAGLLLKNGNVVDGERCMVMKADVLVEDGKIVRIGRDLPTEGHEVVDCAGLVVTAGFIDAHVHIESSMVLPSAFAEAVLPYGTTAVIADPHEIVNVAGTEGLRFFLKEAEEASIHVFTVVPSSVPATPLDTNGAGKFLSEDMKDFVDRPEVVGLGEVMCYYDVADRNPEIMDKIALFNHKTIDGHTAGMPAALLDSYVEAGVQNDHECTDKESMLQRYDKGMNIYVREGSAARNARELLRCAKDRKLDVSRFAFCTDDKHLATIAQEGHISYIAAMARSMGFSWGEVARMASYNPCRFYRLKNRGNVKEGYIADLVVADDLCKRIACVIKDGKIVAKETKLLGSPKRETGQRREFVNTVNFKDLSAQDFALPEKLKNIAIELVDGQLLTRKASLARGEWKKETLLANVERYGKNGNIAVCVLKGYGIKGGAIATSVSHDSHNVICAGDNAEDMAVACNRLKKLGGGYVIASKGKIVGELPLPVYGLMASEDHVTTMEAIRALEQTTHDMGVNRNIDAFITLSFVALPVIPSLRLLDTGLYEVETGKFLDSM